jgi:hypothetical protein
MPLTLTKPSRNPRRRKPSPASGPDTPCTVTPNDPAQNFVLAANLREYADLMEEQQADGFRVAAYRRAAEAIARLDRPAVEILSALGRDGLEALPGVGASIAAALVEMLVTGRWTQLERLRGELDPEGLFRTIPGIGPELASRIHDRLEIETLEALEVAAHDGRLAELPGIGERRAELIRAILAERLGRRRLMRRPIPQARPAVSLLLEIDTAYRDAAQRNTLRRIAPKRFNPEGKAWLPVLHLARGGWDFTALFSNTGLAHQLNRIGDWVVIYFHSGSAPEDRCTVVTETRRGPLQGRRVVRGREEECREHYNASAGNEAQPLSD